MKRTSLAEITTIAFPITTNLLNCQEHGFADAAVDLPSDSVSSLLSGRVCSE